MDDYIPNSSRYRNNKKDNQYEHPKDINRISDGSVKSYKKTAVDKIKTSSLTGEIIDAVRETYRSIIIPAAKKTFLDFITGCVYHNDDSYRPDKYSQTTRSYDKCYNNRQNIAPRYNRRTSNGAHFAYEDHCIDTRGNAVYALDEMHRILERWDVVTVANLHEILRIRGDWPDNNYGWINLDSARIVQVREGYIIDLPRPLPID